MKAVFARSTTLLAALALAGCTTSDMSPRPVQVSSFHLGQPIARGAIAVESFDVPDRGGPEYQAYAAAVSRQLARLGWNVVANARESEQVALVGIESSAFEG